MRTKPRSPEARNTAKARAWTEFRLARRVSLVQHSAAVTRELTSLQITEDNIGTFD